MDARTTEGRTRTRTRTRIRTRTNHQPVVARYVAQGAVFVGHVNTDLDSVAGAIGAAALFGGIPAISEDFSKLNGEILFALKEASAAAARLHHAPFPLPFER